MNVSKTWNDADNADGIRPGSIRVTLLADGEARETVTLNEGNGWSARIDGLAKNNANGNAAVYTWREQTVPGYVSVINRDGYSTVITNTHQRELTALTVQKIWDDNNNEERTRPERIVMTLSNGQTAVLDDSNNWTATIDNLPVYDHGEKIAYTWTEQEVIGYILADVKTTGTLTVFTNTLWKRPENSEGKKPKLPGKPTEFIDEYDTPLGVAVTINHVGDCFD